MTRLQRARLARVLLCLLPQAGVAMEPLTEQPGDPEAGRAVVLDRERGHCLLCHRIEQVSEGFQGTIGPPLSGVGARLSPAQLRARVVDPTRLNPATVMPAYHRAEGLRQVARAYRGRPILTAQEVEHVVAFLVTLDQAGAGSVAASRRRSGLTGVTTDRSDTGKSALQLPADRDHRHE